MLISDKLRTIGIVRETKEVTIVCPTAVAAYSGAEVQCLELVRLVRKLGPDVKLICLSKKCAARYHSGTTAIKLLMLLLLIPSILRAWKTPTLILWGLPAMMIGLPLTRLLRQNGRILCTERQWSNASKSRSWIYKLYKRHEWFFNSSHVLNGFVGEGIVVPEKARIFLNIKNREIQYARRSYTNWGCAETQRSFGSLEHIWVGRINRAKNLEDAILHCAGNSVTSLTIFGRNEDPQYLFELREKAKMCGVKLNYAGHMPRSRIFSSTRLLVHTSRAEGMPNSVLDAIIFGTPVVSVPCDFLRDLEFPRAWQLNGTYTGEANLTGFSSYRDKVCAALYVEALDL